MSASDDPALLEYLDRIVSPYAEGYGLGDQHRVLILRFADRVGVEDAADRYNVHRTAIYRWRKDYGWSAASNVRRKGRAIRA